MKVRIILGAFPWKHGGPPVPELEKSLFEIFAQYQPKISGDITGTYGNQAYELTAPADNPQFEKLLQSFSALLKKANPPAAAAFDEAPEGEEAKCARFLEPYYSSDYVDEGTCREPLNPGIRLCEECEWPNLAHLPNPFLVNKNALKKYDVFHTGVSMIIVRPYVLELLKGAVGDQIQFGEVAIAKAKEQAAGDDRLFWVRPKNFLGKRLRVIDGERSCSACGRTAPGWVGGTDRQVNKLGPGIFDNRYRIEHFGSKRTDIALVPGFLYEWPKIVMSGALLAHLKANDVKGIMGFTKSLNAQCVFSEKGEPTLEAQARIFSGSPSSEKLKQLQQATQKTTAEKSSVTAQKWFKQFLKRNAVKGIKAMDFVGVEKKHKLALPQDYKDFISIVGSKSFKNVNGMEVTATTVLLPQKLDFKNHRRGKVPYLEGEDAEVDGVAFAGMDNGDSFVFDVSVKDSDYPVLWFNHEENMLEPFAANFAECIKRFVQRD